MNFDDLKKLEILSASENSKADQNKRFAKLIGERRREQSENPEETVSKALGRFLYSGGNDHKELVEKILLDSFYDACREAELIFIARAKNHSSKAKSYKNQLNSFFENLEGEAE